MKRLVGYLSGTAVVAAAAAVGLVIAACVSTPPTITVTSGSLVVTGVPPNIACVKVSFTRQDGTVYNSPPATTGGTVAPGMAPGWAFVDPGSQSVTVPLPPGNKTVTGMTVTTAAPPCPNQPQSWLYTGDKGRLNPESSNWVVPWGPANWKQIP
jgi:hypothetical protein